MSTLFSNFFIAFSRLVSSCCLWGPIVRSICSRVVLDVSTFPLRPVKFEAAVISYLRSMNFLRDISYWRSMKWYFLLKKYEFLSGYFLRDISYRRSMNSLLDISYWSAMFLISHLFTRFSRGVAWRALLLLPAFGCTFSYWNTRN